MTTRWAPGTCKLLVWEQGMALLDGQVSDAQAEQLWDAVRHDTTLGSFLLVLMETTGAGLLTIPPFAVTVLGERGAHVAVRGPWAVSVRTAEGEFELNGEDITTWEERLVAGAVAVELRAPGEHHRSLPVVCGILDAGQVSWTAGDESLPAAPAAQEMASAPEEVIAPEEVSAAVAEMPAGAGKPPARAGEPPTVLIGNAFDDELDDHGTPDDEPPEPQRADATRVVTSDPHANLLDGAEVLEIGPGDVLTVAHDRDVPVAASLQDRTPRVLAAFCATGHPNPPQRVRCYQCNAPVQGQPQLVERPQLGWLRVAGGEPVPLRGPVVAGRNPRTTALRSSEPPRLIALPHQHISSNHIAFVLEGWSVLVRDLRSSNGSYLRRHGNPPVRLPENDTPLIPGDVIDLGHGVFINLDRIP